mmetsp:Transcript_11130/g.12250  ORF Transcript_11130/g.12250 Transcript_11130/m.12250 type:complete len:527 (+) Transcript_11130:41-1621(+)
MTDACAIRKAENMKRTTEEFRRLFNIPEPENVIQKYRCFLKRPTLDMPGVLYISQNFVCFKGISSLEVTAMRKITSVMYERRFLLSNAVVISSGAKTSVCYVGFARKHSLEAFNLINYLYENPPSLVSAPEVIVDDTPKDIFADENQNIEQETSKNTPWGLTTSTDDEEDQVEDNNNNSTYAGNMDTGNPFDNPGDDMVTTNPFDLPDNGNQLQIDLPQVDVDRSKRLVGLAHEIRGQGAEVLTELELQAERIDRIEGHVDNIHRNLDESNRLLKGIESLPAYIGHSMRKKKKNKPREPYKDRSIAINQPDAYMEVEILYKQSDDSLLPAILRFARDYFCCLNAETERLISTKDKWEYGEVTSAVLRARHEHLDIRFSTQRCERLRMMSSYNQIIVNEIILRTKEKQVKVLFEPGIEPFDYGHPRISSQPVSNIRTQNTFVRRDALPKTSALLSKNVDKKIKSDLDLTDQHIDEIGMLVGDLGNMAVAMGTEIDRSAAQIKRINEKTETATMRMESGTKRMDKLMS